MSTPDYTKIPFSFSQGQSKVTKSWEPTDTTVGNFVFLMCNHEESSTKDTLAYTPATFRDGRRRIPNVEMVTALVYDVDGGMTWEEVRSAVEATGKLAIVYTTYSHKQVDTTMALGPYVKWCNNNDINPDDDVTEEVITDYLVHLKKDHLKNIEVVDQRYKDKYGYHIKITHDPVEKFRVVFPLEQAFHFIHASVDPNVASQIWAHTYKTIGEAIGLNYDPACTDPTRLYYIPSHPVGGVEGEDYFCWPFGGNMMDYRDYDVDDEAIITKARVRGGAGKKTSSKVNREKFTSAVVATDRDGREIDLSKWMAKNKRKLKIQELIEDVVPDMAGQDKGDKLEIMCPFDEFHSKPGGNAAIVSNPKKKMPMGANCLHASCQERATISYLKKMIDDGWFTIDEMFQYTSGNMKEQYVTDATDTTPAREGGMEEVPKEVKSKISPFSTGTSISIDERHAMANSNKTNMEEKIGIIEADTDLNEVAKAFLFAHELKDFVEANPSRVPNVQTEIALYSVSQVPANIRFVRGYVKSRRDLEISDVEFAREVYNLRLVSVPYEPVIKALVDSQLDNNAITLEKERIRSFYDMSEEDFNKIYSNIYTETHGTYLPKEFLDKVEEFDKTHSKIHRGSDTQILDHEETTRQVKIISRGASAFKLEFSNQRYRFINPETGDQDERNVFDYWLNDHPRHDVYKGATFDPSEVEYKNLYNLWSGWKYFGQEGDWQMIHDHILKVWCRGSTELFNWVMTYMSDIFQRPDKRPSTSIAVIGEFGAGKSIVFEYGLGPMIDPYYHEMVKSDQLLGRFSGDTIKTKMACVAEEAIFKGNAKVMDEIKQLISGKQISVEPKYGDTTMEPIHTRFFFVSNHIHALGLDKNDRRFVVLDCDSAYAQQTDYFTTMKYKFEGRDGHEDMRSAWCHALHNWDPKAVNMNWGDLYTPPVTDMKVYQMASNRDVADLFYYDLLINGEITRVPEEIMMEDLIWEMDEETVIPLKAFNNAYRNFASNLDKRRYRYEVNGHISGFEQFFGEKYNDHVVQRRINQKNTKCLLLPNRRKEVIRHYKKHYITDQEYGYATKEFSEETKTEEKK